MNFIEKHFETVFYNISDRQLYENIKICMYKKNHNIMEILEIFKNKIDWNEIIFSSYLPQSVLIKFLPYYFSYENMRPIVKNIRLSEQLLLAIVDKIHIDHKSNSDVHHIENEFWFYISTNPTFPLINNFEQYMPRSASNRIAYNLNFPMDIDFIKKYSNKIILSDLMNHPFLTPEVESYLVTTLLQRRK